MVDKGIPFLKCAPGKREPKPAKEHAADKNWRELEPGQLPKDLPSICNLLFLFFAVGLSTGSCLLWSMFLVPIASGFLAPASASSVSTLISAGATFAGLTAPYFGSLADQSADFRPVFLLIIGVSLVDNVLIVLALQTSSAYLFAAAAMIAGGMANAQMQVAYALAGVYGTAVPERAAGYAAANTVNLSVIPAVLMLVMTMIPLTDTDFSMVRAPET